MQCKHYSSVNVWAVHIDSPYCFIGVLDAHELSRPTYDFHVLPCNAWLRILYEDVAKEWYWCSESERLAVVAKHYREAGLKFQPSSKWAQSWSVKKIVAELLGRGVCMSVAIIKDRLTTIPTNMISDKDTLYIVCFHGIGHVFATIVAYHMVNYNYS